MTQGKKYAPTTTPTAKPAEEVELEDVVMVPNGKDKFRVEVRTVRGVVVAAKVLEEAVSLPVARQAAVLWRSKTGGLHRGLK